MPSRGLSTHISITAEVAPSSSPRFSILRSAMIMASGFLVSSTEPASARILAPARQREADDDRQQPGDRDQHDRDDDGDAGAALAAIAAAVRAPAAIAEAALEQQPEDQLGEEADHAGDDDRDHQHAHVAVADVGELVAEHRFELGVIERGDAARWSP